MDAAKLIEGNKKYISEETIEYHYDKHHFNYVNNLNRLVVDTMFFDTSLDKHGLLLCRF